MIGGFGPNGVIKPSPLLRQIPNKRGMEGQAFHRREESLSSAGFPEEIDFAQPLV